MFVYLKERNGTTIKRVLEDDPSIGLLTDGTIEEKPEGMSASDFIHFLIHSEKTPFYQAVTFFDWFYIQEKLVCDELHHHIHKHYSCPIDGVYCTLIAKEKNIFSVPPPDGQFFTCFTNEAGEFDLKLCDETTGEPVADQTLADAEKAKKLAVM